MAIGNKAVVVAVTVVVVLENVSDGLDGHGVWVLSPVAVVVV